MAKCLDCGKNFKVNRVTHKYCSKKCKFRAWAKKHPRVSLNEGIS